MQTSPKNIPARPFVPPSRLEIPGDDAKVVLRMRPLEKPQGLFMRLVFYITRRMFGRVLPIIKIIYNRDSSLLKISRAIASRMQKSKLPAIEVHLIQAAVSMANGCSFCYDLSLALAMRNKIGSVLFADLVDFANSTRYTERMKAMLKAALAINQCQLSQKDWNQLQKHLSEAECLELVWLTTAEGYFNRMNHALQIPSAGLARHV